MDKPYNYLDNTVEAALARISIRRCIYNLGHDKPHSKELPFWVKRYKKTMRYYFNWKRARLTPRSKSRRDMVKATLILRDMIRN